MPTFLVVDRDPDGLALLSGALRSRYRNSTVHSGGEAGISIVLAAMHNVDAIIVHRAIGMTGDQTVRALRPLCPDVPIVLVSATHRLEEAIAAGANAFLPYGQWLMLGTVVSDLLKGPEKS